MKKKRTLEPFALRIKAALKRSGIDEPTLAARMRPKVSKQTVNQWVTGTSKSLHMSRIFDVARILNVDPEWLATGDGTMAVNKNQELPRQRKALVEAYEKMPEDMRLSVRQVIETYNALHSPAHKRFSKKAAAVTEKAQAAREKKDEPAT